MSKAYKKAKAQRQELTRKQEAQTSLAKRRATAEKLTGGKKK